MTRQDMIDERNRLSTKLTQQAANERRLESRRRRQYEANMAQVRALREAGDNHEADLTVLDAENDYHVATRKIECAQAACACTSRMLRSLDTYLIGGN